MKPKQRTNPVPLVHIDKDVNHIDGWLSKCEDITWNILRYINHTSQVIPAWKGFFYEVLPVTNDKYVVGYLPTIRSSPTKMETVKEVLVQCKVKATQLGLSETDLVLDHAIYCKAVEIVMNEAESDLRAFINLRMGGFHAICIFLRVIGKIFGDAGLADLEVETGLLGENSMQQVSKAKHYNNAMRIHLYVAEAITRIKLDTFEWLQLNKKYYVYNNAITSEEMKRMELSRNSTNFNACTERLQDLIILYEEFEVSISDQEKYPMPVFWTSYLNMVQTLRDFVKSIKIGDWDLHMNSSEKMLHWYHAYDHYNYARHFSYYWA